MPQQLLSVTNSTVWRLVKAACGHAHTHTHTQSLLELDLLTQWSEYTQMRTYAWEELCFFANLNVEMQTCHCTWTYTSLHCVYVFYCCFFLQIKIKKKSPPPSHWHTRAHLYTLPPRGNILLTKSVCSLFFLSQSRCWNETLNNY